MKTSLVRFAVSAVVLSTAATARAEIAVLTNGMTLKVVDRRVDGDVVYLSLKGGGEVGMPPSLIRGVVPDEIVDEIVSATGDLHTLASEAARRHGLDPELVLAVVTVESGF